MESVSPTTPQVPQIGLIPTMPPLAEMLWMSRNALKARIEALPAGVRVPQRSKAQEGDIH